MLFKNEAFMRRGEGKKNVQRVREVGYPGYVGYSPDITGEFGKNWWVTRGLHPPEGWVTHPPRAAIGKRQVREPRRLP